MKDQHERVERFTEETWLACLAQKNLIDLGQGLQGLVLCGDPTITERKVQLFEVACAARLTPFVRNDLFQQTLALAVEAADAPGGSQSAMPLSTERELELELAWDVELPESTVRPRLDRRTRAAFEIAICLTNPDPKQFGLRVRYLGDRAARLIPFASGAPDGSEAAFQVALHRDIFGNPFRPVTFSLEWRTDTAVNLARTMYESREFSAMPILADALEDAGCDSDDILCHCRDTAQVHVRGCWVCDLVLGKK